MSGEIEGKSPLELDRDRVTCLLLINSQLMKKAISLYTRFLSKQQTLAQLSPQTKQTVMESFQNCTRRIHCNLTVLSYIHEKYHTDPSLQQVSNNKNSFPVIMAPPQDMPELNHLYSKLQELYPEALQYLKAKLQQMRKQQQPQQSSQVPLLLQQPLQQSSQVPNQLQQQQIMQQGAHLMQIQRQNSQHLQQNPLSNSPMINTPGSNSMNTSTNTPVLKESLLDYQNLQQVPIHQQQIPNQQYQNGGYNFNQQSQLPGHQEQDHRIQQHHNPQAISPQQIFLNGINSGLGSNGMMDYFNAQ